MKMMLEKLKEKFFGCDHIWLNDKQEDTSNLMAAPSPFIGLGTVKMEIEQAITRKFYLGTTIVDKCAKCGRVRSEMTEERVKQAAIELEAKQKAYLENNKWLKI